MLIKRYSTRKRGSLYVPAFIVVMFLGLSVSAVYSFSITNTRATSDRILADKARLAAESGFNFAVATLWDGYLALHGGKAGPPSEFRNFLVQSYGLDDQGQIDLNTLEFPGMLEGEIMGVGVQRIDNGLVTELLITATGESYGKRVTVSGYYEADGAEFEGFEFALLANNINCIFCHATIDSTDKFKGGPYERVRVSSMQALMLREGSANSTIAGSLYASGAITDKSGNVLNLATLKAGTLHSYEFDQDGQMALDQTGNLIAENLVLAGTDVDGNLLPGENLYVNYPDDPNAQTDGALPSEFPPVFPDVNGDRKVDDAEFAALLPSADGTLTGGSIFGVSKGSTYAAGKMPGSGNIVTITQSVDKNMILSGTDANPLLISGRILVDGDVVISGKIQGDGSIYARGNIYIMGNLTYADGADAWGNRTFGVDSNGGRNKVGFAAGGNILVGDYLTPKGGDINNSSNITSGQPD